LVKPDYTAADRPWLYALVTGLGRDGLVAVTGETAGGRRQAAVPLYKERVGRAARVREERAEYDAAPEPDLAAVRVSLPES
jgi:hypothetical protein